MPRVFQSCQFVTMETVLTAREQVKDYSGRAKAD
jgi:hypothetical protein